MSIGLVMVIMTNLLTVLCAQLELSVLVHDSHHLVVEQFNIVVS